MKIKRKLITYLYNVLSPKAINFLGSLESIKIIRNKILRPNNREYIIKENILWESYQFIFNAPIKIAVKAKKKGIENKLLRNSIEIINKKIINNQKITVLDIGANYGFISLVLQKAFNQNVNIFAFEPHPEIVRTFRRSIEDNNISNINLKNVAIGDENKDIDISLYGQSSSTIIQKNELKINVIKVKQISIDHFIDENKLKPDFIKIDVDGYELNVLRGMMSTIKKYKPIIVIETNDNVEVLKFLKEADYDLYDLDLKMLEENEIPNNVFCL